MGVLAGIRSESVGVDTSAYHRLFYIYSNLSFSDILSGYDLENTMSIELGGRLLIGISSVFVNDPQIFIFLSSIITYVLFGFFVYQNTDERNYWIATSLVVSMGFYFYSLAVLRQALATAIAVQSVFFMKNDRWGKAVIVIGIATLFHTSSLIFLPIIIISKVTFKYIAMYRLIYVYLISVICVLLLCMLGINYLEMYAYMISPRLASYFLLSNELNATVENGMYYTIKIGMYFIMVLIAGKIGEGKNRLLIFISMLCVTADYMFYIMNEKMQILIRLAYHFEPFAWVLLSYIAYRIKSPYIRLYIVASFVIISFIVLMRLGFSQGHWGAVPYAVF